MFGSIFRTPGIRAEEERIRERAKEALSFFGKRLSGYRLEQPAFSLSYANRRRLEMARALATDPRLLLLDEPTAGMNPRETLELRDHIVRMRDELGLTVIVIEHDMRVVKGVSDRVIACDYGQKIAEGTYEEVAHDERVVEAYLGTKGPDETGGRRRRRDAATTARPSSSSGTSARTTASWRCSATSTWRSTRARWSVSSAATRAGRRPR